MRAAKADQLMSEKEFHPLLLHIYNFQDVFNVIGLLKF